MAGNASLRSRLSVRAATEPIPMPVPPPPRLGVGETLSAAIHEAHRMPPKPHLESSAGDLTRTCTSGPRSLTAPGVLLTLAVSGVLFVLLAWHEMSSRSDLTLTSLESIVTLCAPDVTDSDELPYITATPLIPQSQGQGLSGVSKLSQGHEEVNAIGAHVGDEISRRDEEPPTRR